MFKCTVPVPSPPLLVEWQPRTNRGSIELFVSSLPSTSVLITFPVILIIFHTSISHYSYIAAVLYWYKMRQLKLGRAA
jgi:hypothetical protein